MVEQKKITFSEVKQKIADHLKTALDIKEFKITYAKLDFDDWFVNVEFFEDIIGTQTPMSSFFRLNAITGEVIEFQKGHYWRP